ncbi:MAG: carboxylating nicotinate-nucleotide diphosphorylase [Gammaproteobacteria bacterium]|nr:carboxylating nicotinate-nucleotide diphosphorylase [Gammaproteobacteria bacterium]
MQKNIQADVARALEEDVGSGDITAHLIPVSAQATADVISREQAVICGVDWFNEVFHQLDKTISIEWKVTDGTSVNNNELLCTLTGSARNILTGERAALNFLQTLSGTATLAHLYAEQVKGTTTKILDTRKTIPGLREAQKYAVKCGGCDNHRHGLYDGILIKENHITAAGSIEAAIQQAKQQNASLPIEVEVETLQQVEIALNAGADILLLDNMSANDIQQAVAMNNGKAKLEVSGGVSLEKIPQLAQTGVDFISVGALTKHVRAIDLSMRFINN